MRSSVPVLTLISAEWCTRCSGPTPVEAEGALTLQVFRGETGNNIMSSSYQGEAWDYPYFIFPEINQMLFSHRRKTILISTNAAILTLRGHLTHCS